MRGQENVSLVKEQRKRLQNQIKEEETGKLPEKELTEMIAAMIQNFRNRMETQMEKI